MKSVRNNRNSTAKSYQNSNENESHFDFLMINFLLLNSLFSSKLHPVEIQPSKLKRLLFKFNCCNDHCEQIQRMKLISLTFLAVLLSHSCSSGNDSLNQSGKVKTQFSDLNEDDLYIIFQYLELADLFNVIETHSDLSYVTGKVFHHKYRFNRLEISTQNLDGFEQVIKEPFKEAPNLLTIHDVQLALKVLKHFGEYFQEIKFSYLYDLSEFNLNQITRLLNEKCSNSLIQLELEMRHDLLEKFTGPFAAVEDLTIGSRNVQFSEGIRLNDLFPQLKRLKLVLSKSSYNFINSTFPNLEHFHIYTSETNHLNDGNVRELIHKNPTIRSIEPLIRDSSLLEYISQHLPNVEHLTIYSALNGNFQFKNLKSLDFSFGDVDSIDKLSMPCLESLKFKYFPIQSSKWMAFFKNYTQLRHLHFANTFSMHRLRNLDELTADLEHLTEVTIEMIIDDEIDPIAAFLSNHKELNRCSFPANVFQPEKQQILRERLEDQWIVDFKIGSFQRKNTILD